MTLKKPTAKKQNLTRNSDSREHQIQNLMVDRLSARYQLRYRSEIMRVYRLSAQYVRKGLSVDYALAEHNKRLTQITLSLYSDTAKQFTDYIFSRKASQRALVKKEIPVEPTIVINEVMAGWAQIYSSLLVVNISDTTRKMIQHIISVGLVTGMTSEQMGAELVKQGVIHSQSRSATIARTEAHRSANATVYQSVKAIGIEMTKKWISGGDARVRDSHRRVNGRVLPVDEPFSVGASRLMYPSDPTGSASETVNCRCVLVYDVVDEPDEFDFVMA